MNTDQYNFTNNEIHEAECEDQPEGFPCICQQVKDRREAEMQDLQEAEATGN